MGACAVVAEGGESGGHVGDLTTMALVPQVVDAVKNPRPCRGRHRRRARRCGGLHAGRRGRAGAAPASSWPTNAPSTKITSSACCDAKDIDTIVTGRRVGASRARTRNRPSPARCRNWSTLRMSLPRSLKRWARARCARPPAEGDEQNGSFMCGPDRRHGEKGAACQGDHRGDVRSGRSAFEGSLSMGKIAFVFAGQGAQYTGMGKELYESSPAARRGVRPGGCHPSRHVESVLFARSKEELSQYHQHPALPLCRGRRLRRGAGGKRASMRIAPPAFRWASLPPRSLRACASFEEMLPPG